VVIKDNNLPTDIYRSLRLSNELTGLRLGGIGVDNVSYELYQRLKDANKLHKLSTHKEPVHQRLCRHALVDQLYNDSEQYDWDYWCVITFGYFPHKSLTNDVLSSAHYRLDSYIKTNRKLSSMGVPERSRWICLPERGDNGHLHYNCFIKLGMRPDVKTYAKSNGQRNEWSAVRYAMNKSLEACQKAYDTKKIEFRLYERRKAPKDALKMAIYSTKEMEQKWMKNNRGEDHFAEYIRSWVDWNVRPITRSSPKKITVTPKPTATLEEFI
jgi:hypothetical protein